MTGHREGRAGRTPGDAGATGHVSEPEDLDHVDGDGTWTTEPFPGVTTGKPVQR